MDLKATLTKATQEIFETMLGMEANAGEPLSGRINSFKDSVTGTIGLAGPYQGMLAIHIPEAVAKAITSAFLCMEVEEIDEDVKDALGELANMLGGSVKSGLGEEGREIKLSIPSAICGAQYTIDCFSQGEGVVLPFSVADGEFLVECQLQKQG